MVGVISREAAVQANSIALHLRAMLTQRRRPLKQRSLAFLSARKCASSFSVSPRAPKSSPSS